MPVVTKEEALRIVGAGGDALLLPVEEMEHLLDDMLATLARVEAKGVKIQGDIAAASRGRRRAPHGRRAADGDAPAATTYTRKGAAGAVRKRLRALAGDAKKETERLEALLGELQEAIVDARQRAALTTAMTAA